MSNLIDVKDVLRGRAIVLFLPEPEPDPIETLRRQFDPLFGIIRAHLTLVFPFESDLSPDALRRHVEGSVRGIGPILIRLSGITGVSDRSGADRHYLFLNVKQGGDALAELHNRLYRGPLEVHLPREFGYLPHVTLGRIIGRDAFQKALECASATPIDFEVTFDSVTVYDAVANAVESAVALCGMSA